jgi:hypothetical protein
MKAIAPPTMDADKVNPTATAETSAGCVTVTLAAGLRQGGSVA